MLDLLGKSKSPVAVSLFAFCVAPAFISYQPYLFHWYSKGGGHDCCSWLEQGTC
jgi:hypothetical protein